MASEGGALYVGTVVHHRLRPRRHRFRYRVYAVLVDLDDLADIPRRLTLFSHNRFNLFSLHDRDHGERDGGDLKAWVLRNLREAGVEIGAGRVRLLCHPRVLGYVFSPLSVYFCHREDGGLAAVLYEVSNTFGQRHAYLVRADGKAPVPLRHAFEKRFHVSPFMDMETAYHMHLDPPGAAVGVAVRQTDADGTVFKATFAAHRRPLSDRSLATVFVTHPLMTLKVIGAIHWEALRLWRKGVPLRPHPPPPDKPVTIVPP